MCFNFWINTCFCYQNLKNQGHGPNFCNEFVQQPTLIVIRKEKKWLIVEELMINRLESIAFN